MSPLINLVVTVSLLVLPLSWARANVDPLLQLNTGGPSATVRTLLLNSDETRLVGAGDDKVIRVWDARTFAPLSEIRGEIARDLQGAVNAMALSPDDRWLAASIFFPHQHRGAERRGYLRIHDFATGELVRILEGNSKAIQSLRFSADGSMLVGGESLEEDPLVIVWDTATWNVRQSFKGHTAGVSGVRFTPDQRRIISASWDGSIRIWDLASGRQVSAMTDAHDGRIYGVEMPARSAQPVIVTGSADRTVKIWNYETGKQLKRFKFKRRIRRVRVDSTGSRILAGSVGEHANAWVAVLDASSGKELLRYEGHDRTVRGMVLSANDDTVYSAGGFRHGIDAWRLSSGQRIARMEGLGRPVEAVGISADGSTLYWGQAPIDWSGKKYDFNRLADLGRRISLDTIHGQIGSPQAYSGGDKPLRTVRKAGRISLKRARPDGEPYYTLLHIRDGNRTVGTIERDRKTGHIHTAYTLTPDGRHVVTGGEVGYLSLHRLDGSKVGDLVGHNGNITDLAVSRDGRLLVSGSQDQTFKLWDLETQKLLLSFFVADNGEWIAWSSTGHYMSSPNGDRYIGWVINQGADRNARYVRAEQMREKLFRPDIIQKVLDNKSLETALEQSHQSDFTVTQVVERKVIPVDFNLLSPNDGYVTENDAIELKVQVDSGREDNIDWSVTVNQRQVLNPVATRGLARTQPSAKTLTFPVLLESGANEIRVVASNSETEKVVNLVVTRNVPAPVSKGIEGDKLLIISVGVDEYINLDGHDLSFASADAEAVAETFVAQRGKNYDEVETIILTDNTESGATRDNLIDALDAMADLRPNDTVVLFLAGHGIIEDGDYYFLPRDATLRNAERWQKSTVVAWSEIQGAMQRALGRRILLVDTCHAESAFNSRLVKDAEDSDIIVMSSTDSATLAQEISNLGHGVFTYALVNGLKGEADSFKDQRITMTELNAFVANLVPSLTRNAQIPTLSVPGGFQDFVVARL